jgi:hypothetical protein
VVAPGLAGTGMSGYQFSGGHSEALQAQRDAEALKLAHGHGGVTALIQVHPLHTPSHTPHPSCTPHAPLSALHPSSPL